MWYHGIKRGCAMNWVALVVAVLTLGGAACLFWKLNAGQDAPVSCIHCGKCVAVCPMHLMPNYLAAFSKADNDEMCEKFNLLSCVECGCCTYNCPARVPIVQHIRNKKAKILAFRKKMAAQAAEKM